MHTVQGRPFAHVIGHNPEVQAPRMGNILPDSAYKDRILAGALGNRCRVTAIGTLIHHRNAGKSGQQLARIRCGNFLGGLDMDGL